MLPVRLGRSFIAILIKLTSPGPVIFSQVRCGHNGRRFTFHKFRSMVENADEMKPLLQHLNERERKILYLYYGLDDGEERTLEEIGSLLGVTRERIRQIRNRAFEKLRESADGDALSTFWAAE